MRGLLGLRAFESGKRFSFVAFFTLGVKREGKGEGGMEFMKGRS